MTGTISFSLVLRIQWQMERRIIMDISIIRTGYIGPVTGASPARVSGTTKEKYLLIVE